MRSEIYYFQNSEEGLRGAGSIRCNFLTINLDKCILDDMENLIEQVYKQKYLTTKDLAKLAGVSRQRINQCVVEGKIKPSETFGMMFLFSQKKAQEFLGKYFPKE